MKKLMIAAATTLCAAVGFSAVESANTVGYSQSDLATDGGAVLACPQFIGISAGGAVSLDSITCPANTSARDKVTIMTLFGDGTTDQAYIWTRISGEYCWQDTDTMEKAESITFAPGKGLWVQCDAEDTITMTIPGVEL